MINNIQYSLSPENNSIRSGNFNIGINDANYSPTSSTGFWNGYPVPNGGYVIYQNKASNGPSIYTVDNDSELVHYAKQVGFTGSTVEGALEWSTTQDDILIVNRNYEDIVTDGLVLNLDAGFTGSYPKTGTTWYDISKKIEDDKRNHGSSQWYCFESGVARYCAIYPGTEIIKISSQGVETTVVTNTTSPQSGNLTVSQGERFYGTKPIHLIDIGDQERTTPISLSGEYFIHYSNRYGGSTFFAYCPSGSGTVYFYDNVVGGVTGQETSSSAITTNQQISFTTTNESTYSIFYSTVPIIMSVTESIGDKLIMPPASTQVYIRSNEIRRTINNTAPSTSNTNYVSDSLPSFSLEIADGSGGDACQGVGFEYLSDTYSVGDVIESYYIVAPYPNTSVRVSYYLNDTWNLYNIHSLNGNITTPATASVGNQAGGTPIVSNANIWKFEGNKPFNITINDSAADEEPLFGWMVNSISSSVLYNSPTYNSEGGGILDFDGTDDYGEILNNETLQITGDQTLEFWVYPKRRNIRQNFYNKAYGGEGTITYETSGALNYYYGTNGGNGSPYQGFGTTGTPMATLDEWYHITLVRDLSSASKTLKWYINGVLNRSASATYSSATAGTNNILIGDGYTNNFQGKIGIVRVYNIALSESEVSQNYNATKSRYGL